MSARGNGVGNGAGGGGGGGNGAGGNGATNVGMGGNGAVHIAAAVDANGPPKRKKLALTHGTEVELARCLLEDLMGSSRLAKERPRPVYDEGNMYSYDRKTGIYKVVPHDELSRIVQSYDGSLIADNPGAGEDGSQIGDRKFAKLKLSAQKVYGAIKLAQDLANAPGFFLNAPVGRAFTNGFLKETANKVRLVRHTPQNRARHFYPFSYDKRAVPKKYLQFLEDIFKYDPDRAQRILHVQEITGIAALGIAWRFHRCAVWVSTGGAGRSTLMEIISASMPSGSVVSVKPQQFDDPHRRALLVGACLNAVDECPNASIFEAAWLKQIVDGNPTDAEHKWGHPFKFQPIAQHIYLCNDLFAAEPTEAFFRRVIVLTFTRAFHVEGGEDLDIAARIIREELPEIVSWSMQGAARAIRQGLTFPASHEAMARQWRYDSDSVASFLVERMVLCNLFDRRRTGWTQAAKLYRSFVGWCDLTGHKSMKDTSFYRRLRALGFIATKQEEGKFYPVRARKDTETGLDNALDALVKQKGGRKGVHLHVVDANPHDSTPEKNVNPPDPSEEPRGPQNPESPQNGAAEIENDPDDL